ncbi:MAG TPA: FtsW/RodA/SpoVE family cell cycle protein, partial [Advenella sp.]|nr:FtsW/RodA/SpoVE family cell cycle protein [Advenella sp.]
MSLLGDLRASVNAVKPGRTRMRNYDLLLVAAVVALLMFGLLMVFSASIALVDGPKYSNSTRYYFFVRHAVFIAIGLVGFAITISLPMHIWEKFTLPLFFVSLFMLVLVLIPHIGNEVNGAYRWIPLGPLNFQPSELTKLAMLLFAADYTVRKQKYMHDFWRGFAPMMVALGVVGILLLL